MGLVKAFSGAISGTFADQWKDIITVGPFNEHIVVMPGYKQETNNGRGSNTKGSDGIITNGSKIFVPENTAACILSQSGIEDVVAESGGYEYQNGTPSLFNGDGFKESILKQTSERIKFGGISEENKQVIFINMREVRGIKFGTRGPLIYNDKFYGTDLEIKGFGSFTIKITDPIKFTQNFLPANMTYYTFDDKEAKEQLLSEFLQSFIVALNSLSSEFRISALPSQANNLKNVIAQDSENAGTWQDRFGFSIVQVAIENIEFTEQSRELVRSFSEKKMEMGAYEGVSQSASNMVAQQKIASGIEQNGLGDGAGMVFGMNFAQGMSPDAQQMNTTGQSSTDSQIEDLTKFKKLLDDGILTQEEFDAKKKQILGL